jgi:Spy/CpxP family protein refolding chaperone
MIVIAVPGEIRQSSNVTEVKEMKRKFLSIAGASVLAAGMALAQSTAASNAAPNTATPNSGEHSWRHGQPGSMVDRLSAKLNLTDAQKQQAKTIFANARQTAKPVRDQLKQDREALRAAAKSGAPESQIDQLANKMGPLMAKETAIRAKAFEKFYSILTPAQQAQLDQMHANRRHAE